MPGQVGLDYAHATLLQGVGATTLSTVAITGTAGQFSCAAATLVVGMPVTISGTFGGTGSITGYVNPTTYKIGVTNGTTTFTLVNPDGSAIVTTAGTPTGLTYSIPALSTKAGVIGYLPAAGVARDTQLLGVILGVNGTAVTLTIAGFADSLGVAANMLLTGSTTNDVVWTFPDPILNEFGAFVFTPSVGGKIWVLTRAYVGP